LQQADNKKLFEWMNQHAHEYGFVNSYSSADMKKNGGYVKEERHWRFV
jgi:LAS superfamily LD-carboxypeptidase LdcB